MGAIIFLTHCWRLLSITKNRSRMRHSLFGAFGFCSRHQRVKNNENQICSNWPVIKWETFIQYFFYFLFPLGEVMENTPKNGPKATVAFGAYIFCTRQFRGLKKVNIKHAENGQL